MNEKTKGSRSALSAAPGRRLLHRTTRSRVSRLVKMGLCGGAQTDKAKKYEEIHDTPLQRFHLMKRVFFPQQAGNPLASTAGAAMHGMHAMEPYNGEGTRKKIE